MIWGAIMIVLGLSTIAVGLLVVPDSISAAVILIVIGATAVLVGHYWLRSPWGRRP